MIEIDKANYIFEIGKIYKEQKMMPEAIGKFKETISKTQTFNKKVLDENFRNMSYRFTREKFRFAQRVSSNNKRFIKNGRRLGKKE